MSNKVSFQGLSSISTVLFRMLPSITSNGSNTFFSQFIMSITVFVLLVAYLPYVSSSPTSSLNPIENQNNKIMFDANNYQTNLEDDSSSLLSSVHGQPFWYAQPRTHANQFLMSHLNDNEIIVPKWFTRFNNNNNNNNDDDDIDDDIPSDLLINKRLAFYKNGGNQILKKRKQVAKPPMEVMHEIVNSIYLKR